MPKLSQRKLKQNMEWAVTYFWEILRARERLTACFGGRTGECDCVGIDLHTLRLLGEKCRFGGYLESCPMSWLGSLGNLKRK